LGESEVRLKKAVKKDRKNFLAIQKRAFPNLNSKKQSMYFDLKVKNKEVFSVFEKDEYIGHICFGKYLLNPPFSPGIFIEELAVKESFRGRGIGTFLIKHLIDYCKKKNIPVLYLGTGDYSNNKNISYYKKLGFKVVGKLKEINPKSEYKYGQVFMGLVVR
jgi:GNAT superfamily N-acetyltransferase